MEQYIITGMSCAACQARVERAVSKVPGVESCSVSLLTNSMGVTGSATQEEIIKAVTDAGYGAAPKFSHTIKNSRGAANASADSPRAGESAARDAGGTDEKPRDAELPYAAEEDALADRETPALKRRLVWSVLFLAILMYFSMGHGMWGWPLPAFLSGNHLACGVIQMILAAVVMAINKKFFVSGVRGLVHKSPNMDTLVAMGSGVSFIWSAAMLIAMHQAVRSGDHEAAMSYMHDFYFESAAMIVTLITVGKMLEAKSKGRTTDALKSLMRLAPQTATLVRDGAEVEVPISSVAVGDIFAVRPGESIPADGIIEAGSTAINEAALTGESIPVDKEPGDHVQAATINTSGYIRCRATRVGEDTTLSQIIRMVSDAAATKAPIAKIADKVSAIFVPAVLAIAAITFVIWLLVGQTAGYALARAISVLVISCPCALGLATPVAIMVGNGVGAKNGILFKTAISLEETGRVDVVALDKTGTITRGEPAVTDIMFIDKEDNDELYLLAPQEVLEENIDGIPMMKNAAFTLISFAAALESKSEHPLAKAVVDYADSLDIKAIDTDDFKAIPGRGLEASFDVRREDVSDLIDEVAQDLADEEIAQDARYIVRGGNRDYISEFCEIHPRVLEAEARLADEGKTPLFFAASLGGHSKLLGALAVADTMKDDSPAAIAELVSMGIDVVMLTGDNRRTADAIGGRAGVSRVIAEVLPDGKEAAIRELQQGGTRKVAMVGDGINDAPALTRADMGIAIGAGADVAIDAADVVLVNSRLTDVPAAIRLSRATLRNIHQNLFWAFCYNIIGIPLAAGAFIKAFGWALNPMFGAAAMSLSSFLVVTNALRLNLFDIHKASASAATRSISAINESAVQSGDAIEPNEITNNKKERNIMTKKMIIEGMMCAHCEAAVKKALETIDGVETAEVSHDAGTAIVTAAEGVTDDILKEAVEALEYAVISVE